MQNFLKGEIIHQSSQIIDKGLSGAEGVIRTVMNLLRKPVFLKGKADWISELPSVIKKYSSDTNHHSIKMTPFEAIKKLMKKWYMTIFKIKEIENNKNIN